MNLKTSIWLLIPIITFHNIEEGITMVHWIKENAGLIPESILPLVKNENFETLVLMSLTIATILPISIFLYAIKKNFDKPIIHLLIFIVIIILINSFQHIINSIIVMGYTPGIITSILINLPFSIYILRQLLNNEKVEKRKLIRKYIPVTLILYLPAIVAIWGISWGLLKIIG